MVPRWSWAQARALRLERHRLSGRPGGTDCAAVVSVICGAHAQVMSAAEVSIALRCRDITRTQVRDALATDHSLVKTYGPRGTVHLLTAVDLPMWTGALSSVPFASGPPASGPPADFRMTAAQTNAVVGAIAQELSGDDELTIDELGPLVVEAVGPWAGDLVVPAFDGYWPRWRLAIPTAGQRGVLCFGGGRGRKVTYTRPSKQVPGFRPGQAAESLRELVRRYLSSFGPASPAQFAQWLAAPRPWASELFESMTEELAVVDLDGAEAWIRSADVDPPAGRPAGVRLLPYFDSYVVGSHPRVTVFPGVAAQRALSGGGQAGTMPVLLVNGEVAGIWRSRRTGKRVSITVEPFRDLTTRRLGQLELQVERLAAIVGGAPELAIGPVSGGHHL